MKKIFMLTMMLLMMVGSTCFAEINNGDLRLGDVYIWQPIDDLITLYGKPLLREETPPKGEAAVFNVDGKKLLIRSTSTGEVTNLVINGRENADWVTPRGIGLYASKKDVLEAYGDPDDRKNNLGEEGWVYWTPKEFYENHPTFISRQGFIQVFFKDDIVSEINIFKQINAKMTW